MNVGLSVGIATDLDSNRAKVLVSMYADVVQTIDMGPDEAIFYANAILDAAEIVKANREDKS